MKSRKNNTILIAVIGVLVAAVILYFLLSGERKFVWIERYNPEDEEPYDVSIFYQLLEEKADTHGFEVINEDFETFFEEHSEGTYISILRQATWDSTATAHFLDFVRAGNTAFLSARIFPEVHQVLWKEEKPDSVYWIEFTELFREEQVTVTFQERSYEIFWQQGHTTTAFEWSYFDPDTAWMDLSTVDTLGTLRKNGMPNLIRIPVGEGQIYLHSTPLAFTNYHLIRDTIFDYANRVMALLPEQGPIFWDQRSWRNSYQYSSPRFSEGPLAYFLSHREMRSAWFTLLFGVILFLLFNLKRKQRIIPLLEPNRNTTLAFAENISALYFKNKSHQQVALKKMDAFLHFVRKKYHLSTTHLDEDFEKLLAKRSAIPLKDVQEIIKKYHAIRYLKTFSDELFLQFHTLLEDFYRKCR